MGTKRTTTRLRSRTARKLLVAGLVSSKANKPTQLAETGKKKTKVAATDKKKKKTKVASQADGRILPVLA